MQVYICMYIISHLVGVYMYVHNIQVSFLKCFFIYTGLVYVCCWLFQPLYKSLLRCLFIYTGLVYVCCLPEFQVASLYSFHRSLFISYVSFNRSVYVCTEYLVE